jgi:S-adenosylmethionine uptake transporter
MSSAPDRATPTVMRGIGLSALGYACFSVQDATVKWLVAHYAVVEILFMRSLVIMVLAGLLGGRRNLSALAHSRNKRALVLRALLIFIAWLC